jgi:hypothetical protein
VCVRVPVPRPLRLRDKTGHCPVLSRLSRTSLVLQEGRAIRARAHPFFVDKKSRRQSLRRPLIAFGGRPFGGNSGGNGLKRKTTENELLCFSRQCGHECSCEVTVS